MARLSKRFYRIQEVSELLSIPATTLRWWEEVFPMFNPNRLPSGQRRFTAADVKMAGRIKELLYVKRLKIDAAIEMMNKTYRTSFPIKRPVCTSLKGAIRLLDEVKAVIEDAHALAKIEVVEKWINGLDKPIEHKNIRGKEYYAKAIEESRHEHEK